MVQQNQEHMPNYNKVILIGHLTRDPEIRFTQSGSAICKIGIATTRKWRSENGDSKEETCFVDVTYFGKPGETIAQYMKKGSAMMIEGRLKLDQWDDKASGQKRSKLGVVGEGFQFLGNKERSETCRGGEGPDSETPRTESRTVKETQAIFDEEDQVPF